MNLSLTIIMDDHTSKNQITRDYFICERSCIKPVVDLKDITRAIFTQFQVLVAVYFVVKMDVVYTGRLSLIRF